MNKLLFATAVAAGAFLCPAESAETSTNDVLVSESSIRLPSLEASVYYSSMKIERGMVENPESVFGYEAEIEWYGLFGGIETCYDMTDINERRGRYNEIVSFLRYEYVFHGLTAGVGYHYKACGGDESDTQAVELELAYETPWVTPFAMLEIDTMQKPGALYGRLGLEHEWEFLEILTLNVNGSVGYGSAGRNELDFERNRAAFREMQVGSHLEIDVCPHVKIVPYVCLLDYFTEDQRRIYDKFNGFACMAGCKLAIDF